MSIVTVTLGSQSAHAPGCVQLLLLLLVVLYMWKRQPVPELLQTPRNIARHFLSSRVSDATDVARFSHLGPTLTCCQDLVRKHPSASLAVGSQFTKLSVSCAPTTVAP